MLTEIPVIGQRIGPCDSSAVALALAGSGTGVVIAVDREVIKRVETAVVIGVVLHTEGRAELQVLDELELCIDVAREGGILALVAVAHHHHAVRVAVGIEPRAVGRVVIGTAIHAVVAVDRCQWRGAEGRAQRVVVLVADVESTLLIIDKGDLFADLQKFVDDIVLRVDTEVVTAVVRHIFAADDTFLIHISQARSIVSFAVTACDAEGVALSSGIALEHLIDPVGVVDLSCCRICDTPGGHIAVCVFLCVILRPVISLSSRIDVLLVHDGHVLLGIEHIDLVDGVLPTAIAVEADRGTAVLATLGGDEHNAVGRLSTVDGCRGCVLQNIDALDISRVERSDVAAHTIYNIKRRGGTGGADTTDVDFQSLTRLSRLRDDGHTRGLTLQGLQRIGGVELGHIVALDLKGSAGDELFLLYTVADDHDIVERVGLFGKLNGEVVACHLHFLLHKTNVGDEKRLTVIGLQGEVSVEIRHST